MICDNKASYVYIVESLKVVRCVFLAHRAFWNFTHIYTTTPEVPVEFQGDTVIETISSGLNISHSMMAWVK